MAAGFYNDSLALLTDLYQLTMAYGYWKLGRAEEQAVFNLFFRQHPFRGGFTLVAGLQGVVDYLQALRFDEEDLAYLASLTGNDGQPMFEPGFLAYLRGLSFTVDIDAPPEGTVVFPQEPLLRVSGPILQCQLLETPLLNMVNFQTLIATKAARICLAAMGEPVMEFGLRRAQGIDGALAASRAAFIGGCASTSNVLAGKRFGIPVKGIHAHSWVMSFEDELAAFLGYAHALPNNCIFLVDTYDTLDGVRKAVEAGKQLRARGYEMVGIRLDSGDLAYLSSEARKILDQHGFPQAVIVASNDLDEHLIASLKSQGAPIGVWGVGTKMVTAHDQPALGGVYKLAALRAADGAWQYRIKLSEQAIKINTPGILQVRRYRDEEAYVADLIFDTECGVAPPATMIDPLDSTRRRRLPPDLAYEELLVPIFRQGALVYACPPLAEIRQRAQAQLARFHAGIKRFANPHQYPVGLEYARKTALILQARQQRDARDAATMME